MVLLRILADDIPTLYDFYTEKLGFKVTWGDRNSSYVSFSEPDNETPAFAIFSKEEMKDYKDYIPLNTQQKSDQIVFCMGSDADIDATYEELKSKGVEFMGEPRNIPQWFMRCVYLRDPEGNLIELSGPIKE